MCAISGVFNFDNKLVSPRIMDNANECMSHRGPDFGAFTIYSHVALAHRRLSILDLSSNANQPMESYDSNYAIVYNGEVYNFNEIRNTLIAKGYKFISDSDTEVVLNSFIEFGTECFNLFNGMFSIAIYDKINDALFVARDQFGIKPLYYLSNESIFCFASEIKGIKQIADIPLTISDQSLTEYLWYGNPLGDNTIYNEINEVAPGTFLTISNLGVKESKFFDFNNITPQEINENEAVEKTRHLLNQSVKRQLIADVPVGIMLSGGIDSSAITAFASQNYPNEINTYSVGFDFNNNSELPIAKKFASSLNTKHTEINVNGSDIESIFNKLLHAHDEPFGDAANIPLYIATQKLNQSVKVVLQGDGGDEMFGGYSRYKTIRHHKLLSCLRIIGMFIEFSKNQNKHLKRIQRFIEAISNKEPAVRNALLLTRESISSNPLLVLNKDMLDQFNEVDPFQRYKNVYDGFPNNFDEAQALFYSDAQIILKDTFLEKVDKPTMANSVEVRVPFLDKELSEFALSIPSVIKIGGGEPKHLLKKSLEGIVPNSILYAQKKGFNVPYGEWLKSSLKNCFLDNISSSKVKDYIDHQYTTQLYNEYINGKGNHEFILWKTFNLAYWLNEVH
tara:strand:- start:975 stop:2834 length:1860 start_codon:yes stop_codon:yes gene_type:complete